MADINYGSLREVLDVALVRMNRLQATSPGYFDLRRKLLEIIGETRAAMDECDLQVQWNGDYHDRPGCRIDPTIVAEIKERLTRSGSERASRPRERHDLVWGSKRPDTT
jgi:hypothetical protein